MILRKNARQSQLCDGGNAPEAKALPPALQVQRYNVFFKFAAKQKHKFTPPRMRFDYQWFSDVIWWCFFVRILRGFIFLRLFRAPVFNVCPAIGQPPKNIYVSSLKHACFAVKTYTF